MVEVYKRYCALDAIIAKKGVISLLKKLPFRVLKSSPLSASSIAVRTALIHSNKIKLKIPQNIDKLFRNAYYGGRCEVFGNICAEETALHFDFKGMYSQCMLENLPHTSFKLIEYDFNIDRPGFYLIYFIQNEYMPVLPRRIDSKLKFVNGEGSGWYWYEEIALALENGLSILKVEAALVFSDYSPILADFVIKNNSIRDEGLIENIIGKNNNNLTYGRLGMSQFCDSYKIVDSSFEQDYECAWSMNNYKIIKIANKKPQYLTNVALAAAITSKARIKLYKGFKEVEKAGGRILYTDTDSIIAAFRTKNLGNILNKKLALNIKFDTSIDGTVLKDAVFALPKAYSIKYLSNGTTKEVTKIKSISGIKNLHNRFKYCFFSKKNFEFKQNIINKKGFVLNTTKVKYSIPLLSNSKRIWLDGFKHTIPIKEDD